MQKISHSEYKTKQVPKNNEFKLKIVKQERTNVGQDYKIFRVSFKVINNCQTGSINKSSINVGVAFINNYRRL